MAAPRFLTLLMSSFAAIGLLLDGHRACMACSSYAVSRRTREIGVRMALGASRGSIVSMILGRALTLIAIGTALGGAGLLARTGAAEAHGLRARRATSAGVAVRRRGDRRSDGGRRRVPAGDARRFDRSDDGAAGGVSIRNWGAGELGNWGTGELETGNWKLGTGAKRADWFMPLRAQ